MFKVLSKREAAILWITAAVIIAAAAYNFFFADILARNDSLNGEIAITKSRLRKYTRLIAHKDSIVSAYGTYSKGGEGLSGLEELARAAGVTIVDLRPQGRTIELRAEGPLEGYLKFMYSVETSLGLFQIKRVGLVFKPNTQVLEGSFSIEQIIL